MSAADVGVPLETHPRRTGEIPHLALRQLAVKKQGLAECIVPFKQDLASPVHVEVDGQFRFGMRFGQECEFSQGPRCGGNVVVRRAGPQRADRHVGLLGNRVRGEEIAEFAITVSGKACKRRPLDAFRASARSPNGSPSSGAKTGSQFEYAVTVKSKKGGVKYRLDSGPDRMTISPTGVITWDVPSDMAPGSVSVILSVQDASAQERLHSFVLKIAG